jgi:hypothetical protein
MPAVGFCNFGDSIWKGLMIKHKPSLTLQSGEASQMLILGLMLGIALEYLWRHRAMGFTFHADIDVEIFIYAAIDHRFKIGSSMHI